VKTKRFAEGTEVPVTRTRDELERLLATHGATQIRIERDMSDGRACLTFTMSQRMVRLDVRVEVNDLPDAMKGTYQQKSDTPNGWNSWSVQRRNEWLRGKRDQREREAWRRLLLVVKAKLELVAGGDTTIEREFLADILTVDGGTVYELIAARIGEQYSTGNMVPLLPGRTA
jgi:hypothetical protein